MILAKVIAALALAGAAAAAWTQDGTVGYVIEAGAIDRPLTPAESDAARGRAVVLDIRRGNCLICHAVASEGTETFQGNIGPPLDGVSARLSEGQLRLRLVDSTRLNPTTVMPSYYRVDGLNRVADEYRGRPALSALEIEDVIAYLKTL